MTSTVLLDDLLLARNSLAHGEKFRLLQFWGGSLHCLFNSVHLHSLTPQNFHSIMEITSYSQEVYSRLAVPLRIYSRHHSPSHSQKPFTWKLTVGLARAWDCLFSHQFAPIDTQDAAPMLQCGECIWSRVSIILRV